MLRRRTLLAGPLALAGGAPAGAAPRPQPGTLRIALRVPETGFDPLAIGDLGSSRIASCIFEAPLTYDYLARPVRLIPQTAAALPEISPDATRFTFRIRPGIFFADDPAFGGKPRELVAQDYVYSVKRYYDPRNNSENLYIFANAGLLGLDELRERALKERRPFDYDTEVEGIRALDRYSFRVRLARPDPRFHLQFARQDVLGAMAREVVERYGADIAAHPVGTGPFRLAAWRRSSRIELERNPRYRGRTIEAPATAPDEPAGRAAVAQLAGARLPLAERIELDVIEEAQPRWLAFLEGAHDLLEVPTEYGGLAVPGGRLAPHLARRGIRLHRTPQADMAMTYFNMRDPMVGGYAPAQVALRRAVALAYDSAAELRLVRHGHGLPAQSVVAPFTSGYDGTYRSEMSQHDPARAAALLDLYGYLDRNSDGWRERPDGTPLVLRLAGTGDQTQRRLNELWRKHLAAVGVRIEFETSTWGELLKRSRTGSLMMWGFSWVAQTPDGGFFLGIGYGPNDNESNDAHFALPAFDRLFERQKLLPDGAQRDALMREAKNLLVAYMPYKARFHTVMNELAQPWVRGFWRHPFMGDVWCYVGTDGEATA